MNIGDAITALKEGKRVARAGWNGKGMWLLLNPNGSSIQDYGSGQSFDGLPWVGMKTADDKFVPWLCSQTDLLADDWEIVQ